MEGIVSVRWLSGAWTIIKEDDTTLSASGSVADRLQTAIDYAAYGGWPLRLVSSRGRPFELTGTLRFPTAYANVVDARGCWFVFDNDDEPGIVFDTQPYNLFDLGGGQIRYRGTGSAVIFRPETSYLLGLGIVVIWSQGGRYDLGTIIAEGGTPMDAILVDVTQRVDENPDQRLTSSFVCNYVRWGAAGWGQGKHGLRILSPTHANQCGGENTWDFLNIEGHTVQQIKVGTTPGSLNDNLGTNKYLGNLGGGPGGAFETLAPWDQWYLHSANIYGTPNANADYTAKFRSGARGNVLVTKQIIPGSVAGALDQGSTLAEPNQINVLTFPPPDNFEGTSGTPAGSINMSTVFYVDTSWAVDNGKTVSKLWLYTATAGTYPIKLMRRNSNSGATGNYDVVVAASIVHGGGGWESVDITPYVVANDGKEYFVGVFTSGVNHPALEMKPRAYAFTDVSGGGLTLSQQAAQVGNYILAVGVTYQ